MISVCLAWIVVGAALTWSFYAALRRLDLPADPE